MSGAIIVADQLTGAGLGSPGVARDDLWQAQAITLSCATSGNVSYQWDLLAAPPGSAATLLTPSGSTSGFTPDLVGTYRIRLTTNGGGPGNVQILIYRVRYSNVGALANRGWAYPAFGELAAESNYGGNALGWAEVFNTILEDIRLNAFSGGGGGGGSLVFVYQQGGTADPDHNVYVHFADAVAAAAPFRASCPYILIDDTFGSPVVPAGTYDVEQFTIFGINSYNIVPIAFADGVTLTINSALILYGLDITWNNSTDPVITLTGSTVFYFMALRGGTIFEAATVPFCQLSGDTHLELQVDEAQLSGDIGSPVVSVDVGSTLQVIISRGIEANNDALDDNALFGDGTIAVSLLSGNIHYSTVQTGATDIGFSDPVFTSINLVPNFGVSSLWNIAAAQYFSGPYFQELFFSLGGTNYFGFNGGFIDWIVPIATPTAPVSTGWRVYVDSADNNLKAINPASTVVNLTGPIPPVTVTNSMSPYTASPGAFVNVDTSAGAVTVIVPSQAGAETSVELVDATNSVTVFADVGNVSGFLLGGPVASVSWSTQWGCYTFKGQGSSVGVYVKS